MPWQVPITVDGLEYPVTFNTEGEPTQQDYDEAVQQILSQKAQAAPEPEPETPGYLSQLGSALGLGYRQMKSGVGATFNALTGDTADVAAEMAEMSKLQREQQATQTPEDVEFMRSLEEAEKGFEQAQGPLESIGALAQYPAAVFAQPGAAFKTAVQSAPNALISGATSLAGYGLGGLVGGAATLETGPGAILGGLAGAAAGGALSNTLMEAGPSIFDVLNERTQGAASNMTADEIAAYLQQNPDIVDEGLKTGAIRGSVIGAVEALGVKGSGRLLTMPERAAARAVQKELMAQGVDVASKEAVDKALLDPALRASTKAVAETAKNQFSSAGNMARLAGASAIETGAAGAGELAAQAAAGQDISTKEAFLEMMGDAALSLPMAATTKAFEGAKYMLNPALVSDLGKASAENLAATGSTAAAEAQEGFNEAIELTMLPFTREDIRATEMPFTREDIRATNLPFTREDIRATQLPFGREDIRATEMPFSREDIRGISTPAPAVEEVGDEVEPLSEGAERNRAIIAEAAAKLRGEAPQDISAGLQAAIPQQPVETQEDAAPEIPLEESVREEPQDRVESREAEGAGAGDQLLRPETGEEEVATFGLNPLTKPKSPPRKGFYGEVKGSSGQTLGSLWKDKDGNFRVYQLEDFSNRIIAESPPIPKERIKKAGGVQVSAGQSVQFYRILPSSDLVDGDRQSESQNQPPQKPVTEPETAGQSSAQAVKAGVSEEKTQTQKIYDQGASIRNTRVSREPAKENRTLIQGDGHTPASKKMGVSSEGSSSASSVSNAPVVSFREYSDAPAESPAGLSERRRTVTENLVESAKKTASAFESSAYIVMRGETENQASGEPRVSRSRDGFVLAVVRENGRVELQPGAFRPQPTPPGEPTTATEGMVTPGGVASPIQQTPKEKLPEYQIRGARGRPATDAEGVPTGWKLNEFRDAVELVSEDGGKFVVFPIENPSSYGDKMRALLKAEDWAIDNPIRAQIEASPMEANYGAGRVEDVSPKTVKFVHTTKTKPGKGQKTGYYPGTYAYESESGLLPNMEGKKFVGELPESDIYTLKDADQLKKDAADAGFGLHSGNGNAEVKYLQSLGFKAMRRPSMGGTEIIVFDTKDANFQPQTKQAAEKQTPVPLREGTGAAGVASSSLEGGRSSELPKVSPETESESRGNLPAIEQIDRLVQSGAKPEEMDKFVKSLTDEQFNSLVESGAFDVDTKLAIKPKDTYDSKRIKRRKFVDVVNASTKEVRKTAQQVFQEEEAAAKKQEKLEQDTKSSLNSIVGPQKKNDIQGTVTKADVEAARAALTNSGEIPNAYLTNVYESREAFLADRMNSRLFPASYARLQTEKNIEGLFENGQTLVFAKEVQVSDLDRGLAKMLGVSDEQAAARRVIAHENGHRAISLFTMAEKRELRGYLMRAYSEEQIAKLVERYTEYADWRTNPESRLEALEELLMRDFERMEKIPTGGVWDDIVQFLKRVWRRLTGQKGEPTLKNLKDVVRLMRNAMKRPEVPLGSFRLKDGGEVKLSIRAYHGTPHKVDKFTTAKIGTGEGAQAYGWGLYFAQDKKIGEYYQKALTSNALDFRGSPLVRDNRMVGTLGNQELDEWFYHGSENLDVEESAKSAEESGRPDIANKIRQLAPEITRQENGNLYTVELLPDADEFLDWDKPLSEQSEKVQQVFFAMLSDLTGKMKAEMERKELSQRERAAALGLPRTPINIQDMIDSWLNDATASGAGLYDLIRGLRGKGATPTDTAKAASEYLASLGIPGIRYLDSGSRDAGDGTRNYVIFDENLVRILEENGQSLVPPEGSNIRFSRPQFSSDTSAAFSAGSEAARSTLYSERDMDIREAIRRAYEAMPKTNSVAVPIGELFAKTEELMPGVTQEEFSLVLQDLFEDNGAVLQEGDSEFIVTTPEGRRAGFVVVMPRAAKASRIKAEDASDAAKTFQADIIEAGKGRIDTASYQGNTLKSTEAPDHNENAPELYRDAAISLVDSLLSQGHSITDIADSFQDPEFRVAVGLLGNKAINPNVAQQAELFIGAEIQNRLENSFNKERNPAKKRIIEKTLKNHKAYYTTATGIGQNLNAVGALQQDPRFKWMFMFNEAEKEMADKAKEKLDTITGGGTQPVTDMVNQSEEAAADEATKEMEGEAEEDQDAIDLAAGEATLTGKFKALYEELKDLIREEGIIAGLMKKAGNLAKASISAERRNELASMTKEELQKRSERNKKRIGEILEALLGKESDAKTPEQKKTRAKRKKMVDTAKKRAEAGKDIETPQEGEPESSEEQVSKAERTAQAILKDLSERYSDPLIIKEKKPNVDAMRELYKERVKQGVGPSQMTEKSFVSKAVELGVGEKTAGILWKAAELEIDAREAMRQDKILQRKAAVGARADAQAHRIIFAKERLKRQSGFSGIESNTNKDTIIKAFQEQVKTPVSIEDFIARLRPLNVSETVAKRLFTAAEREKADLEAMKKFQAEKRALEEIEMAEKKASQIIYRFEEQYRQGFKNPPEGMTGQEQRDSIIRAFRDQVKNPTSFEKFVERLAKLKVGEEVAERMFLTASRERADLIRVKDIKIAKRKVEIADKQASRLIYSTEERFRQGSKDLNESKDGDSINKAFSDQVSTPVSEADFSKRLAKLSVSPDVATRLFKTAAREKSDIEAMEAFKLIEGPDALKRMLAEINKARPGQEAPFSKQIPWREILSQKAKTVEEYRQRIFDAISSNEAFQNLPDDKKVKLADLFSEAWESKRKDILDRMLEREIDRKRREGSLSEAAAKALQKSRNKIIELANLGGFDNDDLMKVLGEKFGIKTGFSEAEKARISELADKLQDETLNPAKRNKLAMEFAVTLAGASEIPVSEIIANWWTSSVLFGPQTIFSIGAAFVNGAYSITTIGTRRMLADLTKGDVKGAIEESILMLQGIAKYLGAFKQAGRRAWSYLWTGNVDVLGAAANDILGEINSLEELKRFKRHKLLAENLAKDPRALRRYVGMYLRFVNRLLTSLDAFNVMVTKAGTASLALRMSGMSTDNIIKAEKMLNLKAYKDQVIRNYFDNKAPTTQAEKALVDSYAEAEMYRAVDQLGGKMENADYLASESAMTMNPTGLGGFFYRSITGLDSKMKKAAEDYLEKAKKDWTTEKDLESTLFLGLAYLRQFAVQNLGGVAGYKFIRFASNKFNQGISYLPMVGLLRTLEAKGDEIKGKEAFIETIHRNQVIGAVLTLAAIAVVKALEDEPDDEERGNFWNGGWQNLTPDQKKQMLAKGQKEYTMGFKFNGRWYVFNYQNWPLNQVLAAIGSMSDQIRFSPKQWEEKGPLSKSLAGIVSGLKSTLEIPALSQLGELAGNRLASKDPTEQTVDRLSRVAAGWVGGFVPRILKDLDFATQPELRKYKTLWEKTASHIPIYRRYVGEDYYDILGKPIKRNVIPGSREFMMGPTEPEYKILGALNSRNIFLTPANAEYRMVGKGRNRRRLTQEEADAYSLETGKGYRQMLLRYGQRALQMPTERARAFLSDKADEVRDRALKKVFRR